MITIISCILFVTNDNNVSAAYDTNEYQGKVWKQQCKKEDMSLRKCCKEKADECLENAKKTKERKDCKKRFKVCKSNKIVSQ